MKPTSLDLRQRVVAARHVDGQSMGQIAERFRLPKGTVQNILERYRESGSAAALPQNAGRKRSLSAEEVAALDKEVSKHPDSTLEQLREACGLAVTVQTIHNELKRLGYALKKRQYTRTSNCEMQ